MDTSRRTFLIGSVSAVALSAAACASSKSSTGKSGGLTGSGAPSGTGAPTPPATLTGEILVWDFGTEGLAKLDDSNFAKVYPNIKVTHVTQPANNYATLLKSALSANKGPDVFMLHAGAELAAFAPALVDLTPKLTVDQKQYMPDYSGMAIDGDTSKGIFGMPYQLNGLQFFYNKKLFTQAGLDPEKPPADWTEFMAACDKLKAAGITAVSAGDAENITATEYFAMLAPAALTVDETIALSNGTLKYNSPKVKDIFEKYLVLAKGGYFPKSWRSDGFFTQQIDNFSTGKAAMIQTLSNFVGAFTTSLKTDLGVFVNPGLEAGSKANYLPYAPGLALSVSKRSKNQDAAFAWATYKTSMANQQSDLDALSGADALQNGALPTDTRVKPGAGAYPAVAQLVNFVQNNKTRLPPASQKPAVGTAMAQESGAVVDGHKTLDAFLNDLDAAQAG